MPNYKTIDTGPLLLPVDLARQLLPGSFEFAVDWIVDHHLDLAAFDARYCNDAAGAPAYPPAMLLKVILVAYSRGIVSSREIAAACRDHITFIALCGDTAPHFTTLAAFVSGLGAEAERLFAQVLWLCDREGLIGRAMFAIDGVKLPSNASKRKSGKRADFARQAEKLETAARTLLVRHRENDVGAVEPCLREKGDRQIARIEAEAAKLRSWLEEHPEDRKGPKGTVRQSNRTDPESAKMATDKGVIQGYCGVAAVDDRHQVIVAAQAHGTGSEQALLLPLVEAAAPLADPDTLITADAGYHSQENVGTLARRNIPALIADNGMRGRDERFRDRGRHQAKGDPLHDKRGTRKAPRHYRPADFHYDPAQGSCTCPAGKALYQNGANCRHNGFIAVKFQGARRDCLPCGQRARCLRKPETTPTRQVCFFRGKLQTREPDVVQIMKDAIDSDLGRRLYGRRFATVEPVFANLRHNKGLDRFTLRGRQKVDGQWKLFCLVHNIEKLAKYGMQGTIPRG